MFNLALRALFAFVVLGLQPMLAIAAPEKCEKSFIVGTTLDDDVVNATRFFEAYPGAKDEFETAAEYELRLTSAFDEYLDRPLLFSSKIEHFSYDADNRLMLVVAQKYVRSHRKGRLHIAALSGPGDLPLNFHPDGIRASAVCTPSGAGLATNDWRSFSTSRSRSFVAGNPAA